MTFWGKAGATLEQRSGRILLGVVIATLVLLVPLITMAPDEQASSEPGGAVFDLRDLVEQRFPPRFHTPFFVLESREDDILTQKALWELYQNEEALRRADQLGELHPQGLPSQPYLHHGFNPDTERPLEGVYSIADAVQDALAPFGVTLASATDQQVKLALHFVLNEDSPTASLRESLSEKATFTEATADLAGQTVPYNEWRSPAVTAFVVADNEKLGGGGLSINVGGDEATRQKEHFSRKVQEILRGNQESYRLWGIAIDVNLESQDEGQAAFPFIVATVIAVLVVVGLSLRSGQAVLLSAVGLVALIVWLKGLSNLVGLKSGLVVDLIVPIAMISLGVDFSIHALHRYREERHRGLEPRPALRSGFAGVMSALVLAMLTDAVAFFANVPSGIESIIGFGIAAGIAVVSALIIMGIAVPLAIMRLDARRGARVVSQAPTAVAGGAGTTPPVSETSQPSGNLSIESIVVRLARSRAVVLPLVAAITGAAIVFAFRLEAQLDVKEFFDSSSDFVKGLDKLDVHTPTTQGEPGVIYVEGDLSSPEALSALRRFRETLRANPYVAKGTNGEPTLYARTVFDLLERITANEYARSQVEQAAGVTITDENGDGIPDIQAQVRAAYDYMVQSGIPLDESRLVYGVSQIRESFFHDPQGQQPDATQIIVALPGTREQSMASKAEVVLKRDLRVLENVSTISRVGLTGSPFTRGASLDATVRALLISLPIAVVACLVVAALFMGSLRYALVTIVPIGLVVAWLYAIMHLTGFHLNFVTATIGAVSIGVGIDYAIHFTQRFREELGKAGSRVQAIEQAARGTGMALLGSASSSVVGFAIMGFAPMPMFSAYGILTAIMIFLAAAAALLVLPSLLMLVTPERHTP